VIRRALAFPLFLFALNFYICRELFWLEYSQYTGSIEGAYVAISRYVMENWRDLTWWPLWYGGVPYHNTYPPLMHWIVAIAAKLLRLSPALAHHAVSAFF
jgi:4-amino-4-deoxy-L-arabinose transferase-like glycosyltransferase